MTLAWSLFALLALAGVVEISLYAVKASGQSLSLPLLWEALTQTRVGSIWLARVGFAFAAAATVAFAAGREGSLHWWAALGLAGVPLLTLTQLSHAAAEGGALLFATDLTHVAAAAAWMGGILAFPTLLLGSLRKAPAETRVELLDRSIPRFSRVATLAVAVLAATGFYAGLEHVPDLPALLGTNYGRALILKLFLVLMMLAIGAVNLMDRDRNDSFDTMVGFELAFAAAVFVATGFLTTLPPPTRGCPRAPVTPRRDQDHQPEPSVPHDPVAERLGRVIIGEIEPPSIVIADYDPAWPERFGREERRIRAALGGRALAVEHIGSTSVPGLAAKPIVDILLVVEDSADEPSYLPALERAGYRLRVREPELDGHRMFRTPAKDAHVHVYSAGSVEIERYKLLRERLRERADERELYARTKRGLAARDWPSMDHYADAKTEVIEGIIARARAGRPSPRVL